MKNITSTAQIVDTFLKKQLSTYRYLHSVSVATSSYELACHFNFYDPDLAYLAGLSHDIGRELPIDYLTNLTKTLGRWRDIDTQFLFVLHGRIAFYLLQELTDFYLKEVDQAFIFHTTGHRNMTDLDHILYIADYIEPNRHHMQNICLNFNDFTLETLSLDILKKTMCSLSNRQLPLHPDMQDRYHSYTQNSINSSNEIKN